jgi:hypothetical protein
MAYAAFFHDLFIETGNVAYMKEASLRGLDARQTDMAAYEMARREGELRKSMATDPFASLNDEAGDE